MAEFLGGKRDDDATILRTHSAASSGYGFCGAVAASGLRNLRRWGWSCRSLVPAASSRRTWLSLGLSTTAVGSSATARAIASGGRVTLKATGKKRLVDVNWLTGTVVIRGENL